MKTSLYEMILGSLMEARILTSFNAFYFSLSDKFIILTFFKAYSFPSATLFTLYTLLYAPSPISFLFYFKLVDIT